MYNKKIRKLYEDNYTAPVFQSIRNFNNPFYIATEQQILNEILKNINLGKPIFKSSIASTPAPTPAPTQAPTPAPTVDYDDDFFEEEDPSVSKESDYYQAEVYEPAGERKPFKDGDIVDKDLSDTRHLIVYNKKENTVYLSHRGTDSVLDAVLDITAYARGFYTDKKSEKSGMYELFNPTSDLLSRRNNAYHINLLNSVIDKYGRDVKLRLSGHSKGGADVQLLIDYLENGIKGVKQRHKNIDYKAYLYNSHAYNFEGENTNKNIHPRRVYGDPVSFAFGREHPNLKTISKTADGKDITFLGSHSSQNFVNQDFNDIKPKSEIELNKVKKDKREGNVIAKTLLDKVNNYDDKITDTEKQERFYKYDKLDFKIKSLEHLLNVDNKVKIPLIRGKRNEIKKQLQSYKDEFEVERREQNLIDRDEM